MSAGWYSPNKANSTVRVTTNKMLVDEDGWWFGVEGNYRHEFVGFLYCIKTYLDCECEDDPCLKATDDDDDDCEDDD